MQLHWHQITSLNWFDAPTIQVSRELANAAAWEISWYVLSSVLVKVTGFVATLTQKIQMVVMMMICTCLIMLMLILLVIDRCGEPRPWFDIISSLTIQWRVQRYWWSSVSQVFFLWNFNAVGAFCHVTLKVAYKMYPQHLMKNNILPTPSITEKILSVHSYYCGHCIDITPKRNLALFHWLFWIIHSIMMLNMMLSRTSCFHKLK